MDETHSLNHASVMVVDDQQQNLMILNRILVAAGFLVRPAISGQLALNAVKKSVPDVILLDIMMPGMDGLEVCRRLKADPATQHIPVIFISAQNSIEQKLAAFEAGGVDYLTKPFSNQEVVARLKLHLKLQSMQRQLATNNERMQREIRRRELAELELAQSLHAEREHRLIAETLTDATLALTSQLARRDLLEEILQQMLRLVPGGCGHIMLLQQNTLVMACWEGYSHYGNDDHLKNLTQPLANFPLDAQVIATKTARIVSDTQTDPTWVVQPQTAWVRSHVVVPLTVASRVLGLLRMDADRPAAFTPADIKRLEPLARAAAVALENAQLYEQARLEIAERTQTQETLRRYEFIVNTSKELMTLIDRDHTFAAASQAYCYAHNKSQAEVVGSSVETLWGTSRYAKRIKPHLDRCLSGMEVNYERWIDFPALGRRCMDVTYYPYRNQGNLVTHVVVVSRDITDYRNAESAVKQSHRQQQQILTAIPTVLIGLDSRGQVTHWNQPAVDAFGLPAAQAIGQPLHACNLNWDESRISQGISACMQSNRRIDITDLRYRRPDDHEGLLKIAVAPFNTIDDPDIGVLLLAEDVTQTRIMESQLRQAQKLEAVGQLAAGIAHEINTPTQYIGDNVGFIQTALQKIEGVFQLWNQFLAVCQATEVTNLPEYMALAQAHSQARVSYLMQELPLAAAEAMEGVERVTQIVKAMKDFSHPGVEQQVPIDINRAIASTITVSRNEWKYVAELTTNFDPELPPVPCFPGELNQAILNIIVNAAHAIAEQNSVGNAGKGKITISTCRRPDHIEIRIADNGAGIPPEIQNRIFDPFFTTKEVGKGTGQGLAISHAVVVEKHHGAISFESVVGQGTTFTIKLPLQTQPATVPLEMLHG